MNNEPQEEELLRSFVHVEFKKFLDTDYKGNEARDGSAQNGYVIYNDYRKDFGTGTFWSSDDYTINRDVLDFIQQRHPGFMNYIDSTSGFFIEGTWHVVGDGKLS